MGYGRGGRPTQALNHGAPGVWDLVLSRLAAQLQHSFHRLVYTSSAAGIAARFQPAQGADGDGALQAEVAILGQLPTLAALGIAGRLQTQRSENGIGVVQLKEIYLQRR